MNVIINQTIGEAGPPHIHMKVQTMNGNETMDITILEDGTIKIESGKISAQQHMSAEAFLRNVAQVCGGKQERKHKQGFIGAAVHAVQHAVGSAHKH